MPKGKTPAPARVEPTVGRPAPTPTQPHPTMLGPDGKPLQVPVQPSAAPAAPAATGVTKPDNITQSTWNTLSPAEQSKLAAQVAKQELRRVAPTAGQKAADWAKSNPLKTTAAVGTIGTAAYMGLSSAYKNFRPWGSEPDKPAARQRHIDVARELLRDKVAESDIRNYLANNLKLPPSEIDDIMAQAGQFRQTPPRIAPPISPAKRAEMDPDYPQPPGAVKEARYQGRDVELGQPQSNTGGGSKYKVYVRDPQTGNIRKVTFGDPNMTIKRDDPERRKNFRARHGCGTPRASDRTKAAYWSCRMWSSTPVSKILKGK